MSGITAILRAYNERLRGSVVLRTLKFADRVAVIDDGSSDRTSEVAALAGAQVLRHAKNQGKGAALKTGFEAQDIAESPTNFTKGSQIQRKRSDSSCFSHFNSNVWGRWI